MRLDTFTIKSQELIQNAQSLAPKLNHQQIEPEHLLLAMLEDRESVAVSMIRKLGAGFASRSLAICLDRSGLGCPLSNRDLSAFADGAFPRRLEALPPTVE